MSITSSQFLRFIIAGGIAAAANYSSRFLFDKWLDYVPSIVLAYLTGMVVAFLLMKGHVFNPSEQTLKSQIIRFGFVNLAAVIQTIIVSVLCAYWLLPAAGVTSNSEAIAHLIGVIIPVITSFLGHKYFTFK